MGQGNVEGATNNVGGDPGAASSLPTMRNCPLFEDANCSLIFSVMACENVASGRGGGMLKTSTPVIRFVKAIPLLGRAIADPLEHNESVGR